MFFLVVALSLVFFSSFTAATPEGYLSVNAKEAKRVIRLIFEAESKVRKAKWIQPIYPRVDSVSSHVVNYIDFKDNFHEWYSILQYSIEVHNVKEAFVAKLLKKSTPLTKDEVFKAEDNLSDSEQEELEILLREKVLTYGKVNIEKRVFDLAKKSPSYDPSFHKTFDHYTLLIVTSFDFEAMDQALVKIRNKLCVNGSHYDDFFASVDSKLMNKDLHIKYKSLSDAYMAVFDSFDPKVRQENINAIHNCDRIQIPRVEWMEMETMGNDAFPTSISSMTAILMIVSALFINA